MSTNQQIINRALYELGSLEYGSTADATDSADALNDLNVMMAAKEQDGWDLNWFPQDDLTETCPVPRWAEKGVVSNLALECAGTFNIMPTAQTVRKAEDGERVILNTCINLKLEGSDMSHLPQGENIRYNIETDEF